MRLAAALSTAFLVLTAESVRAAEPFGSWLENLRTEALGSGISEVTLDAALEGVEPILRVIELDRRQPEGSMTFDVYLERVATPARVAEGRRLLEKHRATLDAVSARYGVQPQYIVALWGIETSFGGNTGGFDVIPALATLAWDGRRAEFFRGELLSALRILDEGHIGVDAMQGSWAGAMGQSQFMPSSFEAYAVDWDGDGRRDIWGTLGDVFASAANYLAKSGWKPGQRWGRAVRVPDNLDEALIGLDTQMKIPEWAARGVTRPNGAPLPIANFDASIVMPDGPGGNAYIVYDNYRTIMRWNRSTYFATTVGILADRIGNP